jgi:hypothetical protein
VGRVNPVTDGTNGISVQGIEGSLEVVRRDLLGGQLLGCEGNLYQFRRLRRFGHDEVSDYMMKNVVNANLVEIIPTLISTG